MTEGMMVRCEMATGKQPFAGSFWQRYGLALAHHAARRQVEADAKLTELIKDNQLVAAYQIASVYAFRGEIDAAFEWLERAYRQRDGGLPDFLKLDPVLANLHDDPPLADLSREDGSVRVSTSWTAHPLETLIIRLSSRSATMPSVFSMFALHP